MSRDSRFDLIDQEQLAAQLVAVMDAHFQRPDAEAKVRILRLAEGQIAAKRITSSQSGYEESLSLLLSPPHC